VRETAPGVTVIVGNALETGVPFMFALMVVAVPEVVPVKVEV